MSTILIVDDNEQNLYLLQTLLGSNGFEVLDARNGQEALDMARQSPPDVIISDILMPAMDGFALCREWRLDARLREVPFVFYTATYTDPKDEQLAFRLGAARFIVKPAEPEVFMVTLREVLEEYQSGALAAPDTPDENEVVYYQQYNQALVQKLEAAKRQLDSGNGRPAANQLRAFINETEAMVRSGMLSEETGQALINEVNRIIATL